jgi:hypothetical protein
MVRKEILADQGAFCGQTGCTIVAVFEIKKEISVDR